MTFRAHLEQEAKEIFQASWRGREGKVVPGPQDLSLGNEAVKLNAAVLYADMADSTDLVDQHTPPFAARIYKAYLRLAVRILQTEGGSITAYDGDRVMAVFLGETKETVAVRSALKIHFAAQHILNPLLKKHYPHEGYQLKHVVRIDTSELFVARIGVRKEPDLVWVGRAANYAAKLCSQNGEYTTYITRAVFRAIDDTVKYREKENKELLWCMQHWAARGNMRIYGSTHGIPIE